MSDGALLVPEVAEYTAVGLRIANIKNIEQAEQIRDHLFTIKESSIWAIGDLLVWAEDHMGEEWTQIIPEDDHRKLSTLMMYQHVSRLIPLDHRRRALSWGHHQIVAKYHLDPESRSRYLVEAEEQGWDRQTLADHVPKVQPRKRKKKLCPHCGMEL